MVSQNAQKIIIGAASLSVFALIWELIAILVVVSLGADLEWETILTAIQEGNSFYLPRFSFVVAAFFNAVQTTVFFVDIGISMSHFLFGAACALILGIPIGMIMGWFPFLDKAISPIVELFRPIPPLAWIPFAILWFHLAPNSPGFIIFMGMIFPIILSTYSGFKNVSKIYVEAAKVLGSVSNVKLIRYIAVPAASPMILSGIRTSMGVGWMCLAASEMFGVSNTGIGYKLWFYFGILDMTNVVVCMLTLGLIGLLLDLLFNYLLHNRLLKWQKGTVI